MPSTAPATSLAASTSLADAEPHIALGALDGRYRGVVAPLVDHLSEPALNRARSTPSQPGSRARSWACTCSTMPGTAAVISA